MPGAGFWGCWHAGSGEAEPFGDQPAELLINKIKSGRILYIPQLLTGNVLEYKNTKFENSASQPTYKSSPAPKDAVPRPGNWHTPGIKAADAV